MTTKSAGRSITGERVTTATAGFNPTWQRHRAAYSLCERFLGRGRVLDLGCGVGHSSELLGERESVGVDTDAEALAGQPRETQVADMRELPFADESFDAAVNLFTSLGYLGDDEDTRVLAEIGRTLRAGGRLVVEIGPRARLVSEFREQDWRLLGEGRLLLEQRTFDVGSGVAQTTQTLIDGAGARESRSFSVRVYTATELVAMLERAGFAEIKCYGDLEGGPLTTRSRLVLVARRD